MGLGPRTIPAQGPCCRLRAGDPVTGQDPLSLSPHPCTGPTTPRVWTMPRLLFCVHTWLPPQPVLGRRLRPDDPAIGK